MARALTPAEVDELLAAYALDAVEPEERAQIEAWLVRSPAARREVDELRETASLLAQEAAAPPDELWASIEARLGEPRSDAPPPPPLRIVAGADAGRGADQVRTSPRRPWLLAAAAVLVVVIAVGVGALIGRQLADQRERIDRLAAGMEQRAMERAALTASMEPGSRTATLVDDRGRVGASVVVTAEGRGYVVVDELPPLPEGRTYQLWAVMGNEPGAPMVSAGVMGREPGVMAFSTDATVTAFMVTDEAAPGVSRSRQEPMLHGQVA